MQHTCVKRIASVLFDAWCSCSQSQYLPSSFTFTYLLTAGVVGTLQMISQPVSSIFITIQTIVSQADKMGEPSNLEVAGLICQLVTKPVKCLQHASSCIQSSGQMWQWERAQVMSMRLWVKVQLAGHNNTYIIIQVVWLVPVMCLSCVHQVC